VRGQFVRDWPALASLEEVVKGLVVLECFKFMKETDW